MVQRAVRSETERGAMATERLSMRQIREILRQKWTLGRTHRQVAEGLRVGLGTVSAVERRARAAGLDWAQVGPLSHEALEARVYGPPTPPPRPRRLQLHLRRSHAHAAGPRLAREPSARLPLLWRRHGRRRPRSVEKRRGGPVPLRAGAAADL